MAATSDKESVSLCCLSASGKQFKWYSSQEGLLKLLQEEFDFTKWSLTKQDDKMAFIKGSNVTVNWSRRSKSNPIELNFNRTQSNSIELNRWIEFD